MNGVSGLNTRTILVNRDNELAAMLSAGGRYTLCMNDPSLSAMAAGQGIRVIHRESGDAPEDEPLRQDPAAFVQKRAEHAPGAAYIHLLNEIDPSPDEQRWTREALKYVHSIKRHAVVGNYATHRSREQWEFARPLLAEAAGAGDAIGFHLYVPDADAAGGLEWRPTQLAVGGRWFCTEFAFGRYAAGGQIDPHRGWRGITPPAQRRAFIEKWTAFFAAMGIALLYYCYDFWDKPTLEIAKAEGFGYNDLPDVIDAFRDFSTIYPIKEIPAMPTITPAPDGLADPFATKTTIALKLRPTPATAQPEIRVIPQGVNITVYQKPRIPGGDYLWVYTQDGVGNSGYTAVEYAPGKPSYDPPLPAVVDPPPVEPPQTITLTIDQYNVLTAALSTAQRILTEVAPAPVAPF